VVSVATRHAVAESTRNPEPGTQNPEPRTRNPERGRRNNEVAADC